MELEENKFSKWAKEIFDNATAHGWHEEQHSPEHYLGLKVEERVVPFEEVKEFAEAGLCGTAAVISPIGKIVDHGKEICLPAGMEDMGPVTRKLYETLTGIQMGKIEAPEGWIHRIDV